MYILINDINRLRIILNAILYFLIPVSAIMLLGGCGGNKNIIPASRLTSGRLTLSWNDVPQAVAYNIHLSTTAGVTALNAFKISDVASPITITDLEPGTTYYFIVIAVDESGQGEISKEVAYTATHLPEISISMILKHPCHRNRGRQLQKPVRYPPVSSNPETPASNRRQNNQRPLWVTAS